jgi:hypothetical protein
MIQYTCVIFHRMEVEIRLLNIDMNVSCLDISHCFIDVPHNYQQFNCCFKILCV